MCVHMDWFTILVISLGLQLDKFISCQCARGQPYFLFHGSQVGVYFPLVGCILMWLCVFADYLPVS